MGWALKQRESCRLPVNRPGEPCPNACQMLVLPPAAELEEQPGGLGSPRARELVRQGSSHCNLLGGRAPRIDLGRGLDWPPVVHPRACFSLRIVSLFSLRPRFAVQQQFSSCALCILIRRGVRAVVTCKRMPAGDSWLPSIRRLPRAHVQ